MPEYTRHYKYLRKEHYAWRDFLIHFKTSNTRKSFAENAMDDIMFEIFGWGILAFSMTKTKTDNSINSEKHNWLVRTVIPNHRKYPKSVTWGTYKKGKINPIDWDVNEY